MRICYIADASSLHTQRWVNYFARREHEIHVISELGLVPGRGGEGYVEGVQLHLLTRLAPRIWPVSKYFSGLLWLIQVRRLVKRIKPDIVDAHYITPNGYMGVFSGFHPLILTAWGSDILIQPRRNPLWRILTRYALKKAEIVICNSDTVRKGLFELGASPSKIRKVYNGIDTQQFNPRQKDEALKNSLGISGAPTVICIRNFRPAYNVRMLIQTIPLILEKVPAARFILAGSGEQRDYLNSLANSLEVSDSIRFVGRIPRDELPRYLSSSEVYVSTSLTDSTSLSLQEAMACELAPVVTDLPANREWITDGENGFIVPINDTHMLADRVVYLLKNKEAREKFGKASVRIIVERAEYAKQMGGMEEIYQKLAHLENEGLRKQIKC